MTVDDLAEQVSSHYTPVGLKDTFNEVLRSWGKDTGRLTPEELAPIDQFHFGGAQATIALAALAEVSPDTRVLDVGGGFGGPARVLAQQHGCRVTVVDLTQAYLEVGEMLTERCGLADLVSFRHGDALALPFPDGAFDQVWTQHSSMNIADKRQLYAEIHRVLRPGGRLAMFENMAGTAGAPHYPLPWARDASISFLSAPDEIRGLLTDLGLRVVVWEDLTDSVVAELPKPSTLAAAPKLHLVLGEDFQERAGNMMRNFIEHRTSLIRGVLERA
jgi:MPBQ/MSBQ methyltransferase